MEKATAPRFQMSKEGEVIALVGERADVQARINKRWDIMLESVRQDSHGPKDQFTIATYRRNPKQMAGREDDHFAEVFKVLHQEKANYILVIEDGSTACIQYSKEYIQSAYNVYVLGIFRKGSPEVEALIKSEEVAV